MSFISFISFISYISFISHISYIYIPMNYFNDFVEFTYYYRCNFKSDKIHEILYYTILYYDII